MKVVSYPEGFKEKILEKFGEIIDSNHLAEGRYYNADDEYIHAKNSVPVTSGGAALYTLLSYQKYIMGRTHVILQSNTMRGLYTTARLLDMEVITCDSSAMPGFLAMDSNYYSDLLSDLERKHLIGQTVTVYSVIGGYLSSEFFEIEEMCKEIGIPLIVDMAHGHCLDDIIQTDYSHLAFSFYATKVLPVGEGGLISTKDINMFQWIKRFLIYDRFDYNLEQGLNLRANEFTACFIHKLMTDGNTKSYFINNRIKIAKIYRMICEDNDIEYLDFENAMDYNGYKFVVFDNFEAIKDKNTLLTKLEPSSPVFAEHIVDKHRILYHWCPPTYSSLYDELSSINVGLKN